MIHVRALLAAVAILLPTQTARAQDDVPVDVVEDIVVTARRSGAPIWQIRNGENQVILVGAIHGVPRQSSWRPDALTAAVQKADAIILSQSATMTMGDYLRLRRARARLPEGRVAADYLSPADWAQLEVIGRQYRQNYSSRGLTAIATDLLNRLGWNRDTGDDAADVVRRASRTARKPVTLVGNLNARHLDEAIAIPNDAQVACTSAAIAALEAGPQELQARGLAWTRQSVRTVLATPLEQALDRCGWFADTTLREQARAQWATAMTTALSEGRTTLVVAPLVVVAEVGGLLDQAARRNLEIEGPRWRAE